MARVFPESRAKLLISISSSKKPALDRLFVVTILTDIICLHDIIKLLQHYNQIESNNYVGSPNKRQKAALPQSRFFFYLERLGLLKL